MEMLRKEFEDLTPKLPNVVERNHQEIAVYGDNDEAALS